LTDECISDAECGRDKRLIHAVYVGGTGRVEPFMPLGKTDQELLWMKGGLSQVILKHGSVHIQKEAALWITQNRKVIQRLNDSIHWAVVNKW
jgi:hypothetical protein